MTLSTKIRVLDPVPVEELFQFCRTLLGCPDTVPIDRSSGWRGEDPQVAHMGNPGGIGLPAWLLTKYAVGRPLPSEMMLAEREKDRPEYPDEKPYGEGSPEPYYMELDFDTSYSYRDELGRGCGDLHATYIACIAEWLERKSPARRYAWQNEFTGEWFTDLTELFQLRQAQAGAEDFRNKVLGLTRNQETI